MRDAMYKAEVGDDVYGEDPTVNVLERTGAKMLGKEAAIFVASGTMANLLAIMTHCDKRGREILVGDQSHILLWEQAGAAQIAGVQLRTVTNKDDGSFDIKEMLTKVRDNKTHSFLPQTALICVENTHNSCGGRVVPFPWLQELGKVVKPLEIPLHMDGARFFNSVVSSGIQAKDIVKDFDSINICLSKGLGAPVGSLLVGREEFIRKARYLRKALGGGMRQVGLVAAAGIYALENMVERLKEDHAHTLAVAKGIHETGSNIVTVDIDSLQTNILLINLDTNFVTAGEFCKRLAMVTSDEIKSDNPVVVKMLPWTNSIARLVVCCNNTNDDIQYTIKKMKLVINEIENETYKAL
ncbi:hypothetical protein AAG570_011999 [Ranatra chinensis]|uniref:Aromatic amino acid beta-eliminating lyase/threonine aldolase domain-containing protein n=1 Tax=Ranatra chinensis TaxID=642074 RepID=A0ABD0YHJ6_9HEMI